MSKATLLDPRLKDSCFLIDTTTRINAASNLKIKMSTLRCNQINRVNQIEDENDDFLKFRDK
jgi:hypothetical protein